jgi:hypothetical protein
VFVVIRHYRDEELSVSFIAFSCAAGGFILGVPFAGM